MLGKPRIRFHQVSRKAPELCRRPEGAGRVRGDRLGDLNFAKVLSEDFIQLFGIRLGIPGCRKVLFVVVVLSFIHGVCS